jgi:hypothetical protein
MHCEIHYLFINFQWMAFKEAGRYTCRHTSASAYIPTTAAVYQWCGVIPEITAVVLAPSRLRVASGAILHDGCEALLEET